MHKTFSKIKEAKRIVTEAGNISKCPCCNYHKQAIIQCAQTGHQTDVKTDHQQPKEESKNATN